MYKVEINPRFRDTDALGHINNAAFATWMEEGRRPLFQEFNSSLSIEKWNLIIARVEIDFLAQCYYGKKAFVETAVEKIGKSSVTLVHEVTQEGTKVARGKVVMVHFDYAIGKSVPIPERVKTALEKHLVQ